MSKVILNHCKGYGVYILRGQRIPGKALIAEDLLYIWNNIQSRTSIRKIKVKENREQYIDNKSVSCRTDRIDNFFTPSSNQVGISQGNKFYNKKPQYSISHFLGPSSKKSKQLYQRHHRNRNLLISKYSTRYQKNRRI
jgi:hypothetical protein